MKILRNQFLAIAALLALVCPAQAEVLTLSECVASALSLHPDLAAAAAKAESAKATISQNAADGRLQASAGTSYTRSDGSSMDGNGDYGTNVTLNQSVYDWGKRSLRVKGAQLNTDAASSDYLEQRDTVIANVKIAYYGLNSAARQRNVAKLRYENYEKRLNWAKSYYEVGTKAKIEVTKAESDLANSKLTLVKAESAIALRKAELASAMGTPLLRIDGVQDALDYEDWSVAIEDAVKRAMSNRAELAAQQKRVEYAATNLELQKKGLAPSISASAGYNTGGASMFDDDGWNAKLSFNIPLIDGGLTKSKIEGAQADLKAAQAKLDSLNNSVALEVRKAWQGLVEATEALMASSEAERTAKATYDLAEGRYKAGVGDSLEISDAVDSYAVAQANTVASLYECKTARLSLEKAMGGLE